MKFVIDVIVEGGIHKWMPKVGDDKKTVLLEMIRGGELWPEAECMIKGTVKDIAGNETLVEITFTTKAWDKKGLVGYWAFDEGKGPMVRDSSRNGNDGTIIGTLKWVNGKYGNAFEFTGGGMITIPDSKTLDITQSITIMAWIFPYIARGTIIGKEKAYALSLGDKYNVEWLIWGDKWTTEVKIARGQWYHVAIVYDFAAKERLVYLMSGWPRKKASKATSIPIPISKELLTIGKGFIGIIDDVVIFDVPLTDGEIWQAMSGRM